MASTVELLILGKVAECLRRNISHAATTTSGRDGTIPFKFDPASTDPEAYKVLPCASTIVITFPLMGPQPSENLTSLYQQTHPISQSQKHKFILLGTTSAYNPINPTLDAWCSRHTLPSKPYPTPNPRLEAEDRLLANESIESTILALSGLYDYSSRYPGRFLSRIAPTKEALAPRGSVHYIHGEDVARAILGVCRGGIDGQNLNADALWKLANGQRWILTNLRVFDWWELVTSLKPPAVDVGSAVEPAVASTKPYARWVRELMTEKNVRGLPRTPQQLGRALDSREFWETFGIEPLHTTFC
ncbi:hypothetical protein HDU76_001492 [Blyttiomyces sp. JEL0837]|nr:hypothetical protein HDU76_001492 [Blyttiomyces sp. JEL0837]